MQSLNREIQWQILRFAVDKFWNESRHIIHTSAYEKYDSFEINLQALINDNFFSRTGDIIKITIVGLDHFGVPPENQEIQLKLVQNLYENYQPHSFYSLRKISEDLGFDQKKLWSSLYYLDLKGSFENFSIRSGGEISFTPTLDLFRDYNLHIEALIDTNIPENFSSFRHISGLRELDMGGYGTVFSWFNIELARVEAIKILHEDSGIGYENLLSEARRLSLLRHPNIVNIFDVAITLNPKTGDYQPCIRLELIDGTTLLDVISIEPKPDLKLRIKWLEQIFSALEYANSQGIYHSDLHSCNILINKDGNAILIDFGGEKSSSFLSTHKDEYQSSGLNGLFHEILKDQINNKYFSRIIDLCSINDYSEFIKLLKA